METQRHNPYEFRKWYKNRREKQSRLQQERLSVGKCGSFNANKKGTLMIMGEELGIDCGCLTAKNSSIHWVKWKILIIILAELMICTWTGMGWSDSSERRFPLIKSFLRPFWSPGQNTLWGPMSLFLDQEIKLCWQIWPNWPSARGVYSLSWIHKEIMTSSRWPASKNICIEFLILLIIQNLLSSIEQNSNKGYKS